MANRAFLDEQSHLYTQYIGEQSRESVSQMVEESKKLIEKLRAQDQPVHVIVDLSKLTRSTSASRQVSVNALRTLDYDKIAIFGANLFMKHLAQLIVKASGMAHKVRYFDTLSEAKQWLSQKS